MLINICLKNINSLLTLELWLTWRVNSSSSVKRLIKGPKGKKTIFNNKEQVLNSDSKMSERELTKFPQSFTSSNFWKVNVKVNIKEKIVDEATRRCWNDTFATLSYCQLFSFLPTLSHKRKKKKKDRVNASKRFHCHWQRARKHTHAATLREIREIVAQAGAFNLRESRK